MITNTFDTSTGSPFGYGGGGAGFGGGNWGGGGWGGGFGGGIAPFGLFGLLGLGNRGFGDDGHRKDCGGDENRNLAVLAAIANAKDTTVAEGRSLAAAICDSDKTNLQQFYAAAIQAANNTQSIKDQASAMAVVVDKRFDDLAAAGATQTAAILAKLTQTEIDNLRDQLAQSNRRADQQDIAINIQNSQNQAQAQAQLQQQRQELDKAHWDKLFYALDQNIAQRFSNKTVQFGTGNLAIPTNASSNSQA